MPRYRMDSTLCARRWASTNAAVQTTAIDQTAGVVNLATALHMRRRSGSPRLGRSILSARLTPHRIGAALAYTPRYALFTLVGIAGEDDVDATDLITPRQQSSASKRPKGNSSLNGGKLHAPRPAAGRLAATVRSVPREPALGPQASAELRDQLLSELNELGPASVVGSLFFSGSDRCAQSAASLPDLYPKQSTWAQGQ